jgi:hypothetical protein
MKNFIFFVFCFLTTLCSFSQNSTAANEHQIYLDGLTQNTKTLVINISDYSLNVIGEFKDEIIAWKGKVISVNIDELQHSMTIVHYKILEQKEMFDVMGKYGIKISRILSYH